VRARHAMRAAVVAAAAALALTAAAPAEAKKKVNTWNGTCRDMQGLARWTEEPMRLLPVDTLLLADLAGGDCDGTVNGEPVENEPLDLHFEFRGSQACGYGLVDGSARFTLAGEEFRGAATYRRVGITPVVLIDGELGGRVVAVVRGSTTSSAPTAGVEFFAACAGEGVRDARLHVLVGHTTETFASARP
jgi:hypothetical protein